MIDFLRISLIITLVVFSSCKGKQSASNSEPALEKAFSKTITIEFFSKGSGINRSAFADTEKLLENPIDGIYCEFEKNLSKYGREGERQYCLTFNDKKCHSALLQLVNQRLGREENVRIAENGTCKKNTR